jgi:hypothetical protein
MNTDEKKVFINELVDRVKSEILAKVDRMPDNWDGIELRQYISDNFKEAVLVGTMSNGRKRDYQNDTIIHNL